ncbi:hypothetical protein ST201phi2-1p191 [Pseudomonas phage 201phi2-1]|uniref:Uncharacterized protein n=1 Tax=Pseudomonas phage 201phi2-1 TaxID=198110 RepID=B3FJ54_BP201|nr:hypothetical protein ST201phi2-1p191 [Pseudomonas phage 201phi2-1]ABY63021.1 hypothetical protein 201phi2-1p191 [Pseudomonas phage 201phi2-1]
MKVYTGPFGHYNAGSVGAVLNALCEQEGRSCGVVGNYVIGNGKVMQNGLNERVVATFVWDGDDIKFTWL